MKTSFKGFTVTFFFLLLSTNLLVGQTNKQTGQADHTDFKLSKTINFNGESDKVEIIIPVTDRNIGLIIKIFSLIITGELTIEIFDPTGEKMGNYSVSSQNSIKIVGKTYNPTQSEAISGEITKSVISPNIGNWKVNVMPKNAKGRIDLESIQTSEKGNSVRPFPIPSK
jgi:hypothetical protein